MADFRDPFTHQKEQFFRNAMGEDEYRKYQEYQRSRMRTHIFQGYKDVASGRWKETTISDLKRDFPGLKDPLFFNKCFYYAKIDQDREYLIFEDPGILCFFNHQDQSYMYIRSDATLVPESSLFTSYQNLLDAIHKKEKEKEGTIGVIIMPGK